MTRRLANPSFLVEKLGAECSDTHGLRELTVNAIEAIAAASPEASGRVVWDLDWERADASRGRIRKLSITDTGIGVSLDAMRYYINHVAAARTGCDARGARFLDRRRAVAHKQCAAADVPEGVS